MTIVLDGSVNFGAIIVPNMFVNIVPPSIAYLNGVPSGIGGYVGAAAWGPVNRPVVLGDYGAYRQAFGDLQSRKYDMGTYVAIGVLNGGKDFRCVRVTDGSDTAASASLSLNGAAVLTFTGRYTGTRGNLVKCSISPGSAAGTWRAVVALPGQQQEVFDNIAAPTAGQLWTNVVAAINLGAGQAQGPSKVVIAALGASPTALPAANSVNSVALTGGTDGAVGLTDAMVLGADAAPRSGMYALRNSGCAVGTVCDYSTIANFSVILQFGIDEGIYFQQAQAAGSCTAGNVGSVPTDSAAMSCDGTALKVLAGDWCYWADPITLTTRLVSPAAFAMGRFMNLQPHLSGLNKPLYGIVATQTTFNNGMYSDAELTVIAQARFDLIANPSVGGSYYSLRMGISTSSTATIHGDNYWRLTSYIARTFNAALGKNVGELQTPAQRRAAKTQADAFFSNMQGLGMIGNAEGTTPFKVTLDITNNPLSRVALGYETADAQVQYLSVIEKFILNLQGGQSVQIVGAIANGQTTIV